MYNESAAAVVVATLYEKYWRIQVAVLTQSQTSHDTMTYSKPATATAIAAHKRPNGTNVCIKSKDVYTFY